MYAGQEPSNTIQEAIGRTGSHEAVKMVLGAAVSQVLVPSDDWERGLWRNSIQVAFAAAGLAAVSKDSAVTPELAYTAGLLHDLGRFVMFQEAPEKLRRVDEGNWSNPEELVHEEEEICGLNHADLGALACRKLGIPELIAQTIEFHHRRRPIPLVSQTDKLAALVQVADLGMFSSAMSGTHVNMDEAEDSVLQQRVQRNLPRFVQMHLSDLRANLLDSRLKAEEVVKALGL